MDPNWHSIDTGQIQWEVSNSTPLSKSISKPVFQTPSVSKMKIGIEKKKKENKKKKGELCRMVKHPRAEAKRF